MLTCDCGLKHSCFICRGEISQSLVEAAPDMLAALHLLLDRMVAERTEDAVHLTAEAYDVVTAAVAKAEGRS